MFSSQLPCPQNIQILGWNSRTCERWQGYTSVIVVAVGADGAGIVVGVVVLLVAGMVDDP